MLTNLRFANDVALRGRSLVQVRRMLSSVAEAAGAAGLRSHPDKTKIMHHMEDRASRTTPEYTD
eukprot:6308030-Pyramimonas_sp.AAC.1